jgi:predicted dehydrogenase
MFRTERPDFVDIVTTLPSHRPWWSLRAGTRSRDLPKPFAASMDDAEAMVAACRSAGVPLMVHENFRWQVPLMAVGKAIDAGRVGKPFFGRVSFPPRLDVYKTSPTWLKTPASP